MILWVSLETINWQVRQIQTALYDMVPTFKRSFNALMAQRLSFPRDSEILPSFQCYHSYFH